MIAMWAMLGLLGYLVFLIYEQEIIASSTSPVQQSLTIIDRSGLDYSTGWPVYFGAFQPEVLVVRIACYNPRSTTHLTRHCISEGKQERHLSQSCYIPRLEHHHSRCSGRESM